MVNWDWFFKKVSVVLIVYIFWRIVNVWKWIICCVNIKISIRIIRIFIKLVVF